jgi:hypothetical protein
MSKFLAIFTAAVTGALFSSLPSHAALVSCGTSSSSTMCSLCDVFVTGNTIVNYFSGILLPLALVTLTVGGILYLMNRIDQAKSIITASVLGIILSLSAFLIVNLTMRAMNVPQTDWNTFTCTAQVAATPPKTDGTTFNTTGDGGPKDTVGNPGDITGDPTVTPTTPICNENRDTSSIPMTLPLSLTLNCTNPDQIVSAIWRFPSDSNFGSQTVDNKTGITFTSIDNPSNWTEVTVVVTDTKGRTQTYTYGFSGGTAGPNGGDLLIGQYASNTGNAAAVAVLDHAFIRSQNLSWASLCRGSRSLPPNGVYDHYLSSMNAHLEVYAVDIPDDSTYSRDFYGVGLAWSTSIPSYSFISNTPCAGTAEWVYYFGGGISGSPGSVSTQSYTGPYPGDAQVKPGRWYVTLLWGGLHPPALTSPLYPDYAAGTLRAFVRFFHRLNP